MKSFISDVRSVIDAYERDGFAVSRGLLSPEQARALRALLGRSEELALLPGESIASDTKLQSTLRNNAESAAMLMQIAASPRVLPLVQQFQSRPFVEHTKVLPKLAGAPATPWHQDAAYWHTIDPRLSMLTLWIALGPTTASNGCLRVARVKSDDTLLPHKFVEGRKEYVLSDEVAQRHFQDHEVVDLEVQEGDGVFFGCRTVHGAYANAGGEPRLAFKLVFQDFAVRAPGVPRHETSMEIGIALDAPASVSGERSGSAAIAAREYPPPPAEPLLGRVRRALRPRRLVRGLRARLGRPAAAPAKYTDVFPELRRLQLAGSEREWKMLLYLAEMVEQLADVPGDIAEFGVAGGVSLITLARLLRVREQGREGRARRTLYGFDSFEGLPSLDPKDVSNFINNPEMKQGGFCDPRAQADLFRFVESAGNIRLIKGWFNESLPEFLQKYPHVSFALVHVDCDLYDSTKVVLEHVWERLAPGGLIVFDELFEHDFPGETLAFREWAPGKRFELKTSRVRQEMKYLVKTGY